ncbi:unnamed protein product [Gulo gulo]|uniref:Uncharacterized protein n=1 Tax=Gulo gulo TaxID=48420 RepID=A0A9X9LZ02_GULGU|nr:unnamed protein product [Gulo gulo]
MTVPQTSDGLPRPPSVSFAIHLAPPVSDLNVACCQIPTATPTPALGQIPSVPVSTPVW